MRCRGLASRRFAAVFLAAVCTGLICSAPARASVSSDQAKIIAIQRRIGAQGARVRSLVERENAAQAKVQSLDRQIGADEEQIALDHRREAEAHEQLRGLLVTAYTTGGGIDSPVFLMFSDKQDVSSFLAQHAYVGSVGDRISTALDNLQTARQATERDASNLSAARDGVTHALELARKESDAVSAAIKAEQQTLASVKHDLRKQLQAERQAAQLVAEKDLAKYPWPKSDGPPPPIPPPTPGSYANPLRAIRGLTPERIDMGVDYAGYGPIYAIGDGVVLTTTVPGWPGGTMICYQLTDGPANGLVVYAAEDIAPSVKPGDTVTAGTVLGLMYLGPDGIETGWGDPAIIGNALAGDADQFDGENTTAYGANFSDLLQWLGAPPGVPQNAPPTGRIPSNWPQWDTTHPLTPPPASPPGTSHS
jgi:murein DD-endopeptidase MepM/ murein hydrolase activator NlpD